MTEDNGFVPHADAAGFGSVLDTVIFGIQVLFGCNIIGKTRKFWQLNGDEHQADHGL